MNRQQYIRFRQLNLLGEVAFAYFNEFGRQISMEDFNKIFQRFYMTRPDINWNMLWDFYDNRFEITLLISKEGQLIKVY